MSRIAIPVNSKHSQIEFLGWKRFEIAKLYSCFTILRNSISSFSTEGILTLTYCSQAAYSSGLTGGTRWHGTATELCHPHTVSQERRLVRNSLVQDNMTSGQAPTLKGLHNPLLNNTESNVQMQWETKISDLNPVKICSFHTYIWMLQPITKPVIILHILLHKVELEDKRIQSFQRHKTDLNGNVEVLTNCHTKNKSWSFVSRTEV